MDSLLASSAVPGTNREASQATNYQNIQKNFLNEKFSTSFLRISRSLSSYLLCQFLSCCNFPSSCKTRWIPFTTQGARDSISTSVSLQNLLTNWTFLPSPALPFHPAPGHRDLQSLVDSGGRAAPDTAPCSPRAPPAPPQLVGLWRVARAAHKDWATHNRTG